MQMLEPKGYFAVLDCFKKDDIWEEQDINSSDVLFITFTTKAFIARSNLTKHSDIKPKKIKFDKNDSILTLNTRGGFRKITLFEETEHPITLLAPGGAGEVGVYSSGRDSNGNLVSKFDPLDSSDYEKYEHLETAHLSDYPSFNERLLLCKYKHTNFDPMREIMLDKSLNIECLPYCEIISGKVEISKYGY
jgi:hypothetical protein